MSEEELIAEIARLSGVTIHVETRTMEELLFILALADGAFERGYRTAQDEEKT